QAYPSGWGHQRCICGKCGHKLEENARFCMLCGTAADVQADKKYPDAGAIISFGKENRAWIVLEVKEDKALLLTQGAVSKMPYNNGHKDITWRESELYRWINEEFIRKEFEQTELEKICGNADGEKLFLLRKSDAEKYNQILPILSSDEKYGHDDWWWIQTSEEPVNYVPFVRPSENRVDDYGNGIAVHTPIGVRLAMWVRV
ncbi:MAG: DUF6273 domain-containing protein, partial [Bacillota bacterium]|nr:DUF6273 domain-containing protein [Bacillota bacterium]